MRTLPLLLLLPAALALAPEPAAAQQTDSTRTAPADSATRREANPERPRRRSSRGPITEEEIREERAANLYVLIQRLRPRWLRVRGVDVPSAAPDVVVYEDFNRRGYTEVLKTMGTENVFEIRFVDPINARTEYGAQHEQGVIVIAYARSR